MEERPTAKRRYEIRGKEQGRSNLIVDEFSPSGSWLARYRAYPLKSGDVPVYQLYPIKGGLLEAGRVRRIKYDKKIINQLDVFRCRRDEISISAWLGR